MTYTTTFAAGDKITLTNSTASTSPVAADPYYASVATERLVESLRRLANNHEIEREASHLETLHHADAVSVAAVSADRGLRDAFRAVPRVASGAGVSDPGPVAVGDAGSTGARRPTSASTSTCAIEARIESCSCANWAARRV